LSIVAVDVGVAVGLLVLLKRTEVEFQYTAEVAFAKAGRVVFSHGIVVAFK
jgi:hypothetical protein